MSYNDNKHFHVSRNICCHYAFSYVMTMIIAKSYIVFNEKYTFMYKRYLLLLYIFLYNNKYCYYTSSRIKLYALLCITEMFVYHYTSFI